MVVGRFRGAGSGSGDQARSGRGGSPKLEKMAASELAEVGEDGGGGQREEEEKQ
jgi:hypothetical protein